MLIRFADGRSTFLDFRERAPESASRIMYLDASGKATEDSVIGYRAAGVPGTVRGLEYASRKYGKRPWAELVRPVSGGEGFTVSYGSQGLKNGLSRFPNRTIFLRNGRPYERARPGAA
jgi:gamma-glutamyltranspeptidase/glutathione hydrolase